MNKYENSKMHEMRNEIAMIKEIIAKKIIEENNENKVYHLEEIDGSLGTAIEEFDKFENPDEDSEGE